MKNFLATSILLNVSALVAGVPTSATEGSDLLNFEVRSNNFVGEHYCGLFANADSNDANSLIQSLGGDNKGKQYSIGAHGCYRVACHNTSGVYVCNDNGFVLTVNGGDVADAAAYINKHCCYSADVAGVGGGSIRFIRSGQQFTQWGWNVAVGYADCKAGATQRPSDAGGWGINPGTCLVQQGMTTANSDY